MNCRRSVVKKIGMIVLIFMILTGMGGYAVADTGIPQTPETIGVGTVTAAQVAGSMVSRTSIETAMSVDDPLADIPPLDPYGWGIYYVTTYNEDTVSNGVGFIEYTKLMNLDTANMNVNQYNIEAFKQLAFEGDGTSSMVTTENIFVDGTARWQDTGDSMMCVFAASPAVVFPAFCNSAEAGSSVDMRFGSVTTTTNDRFIMKTGDPAVELNHNVRVIETIGKASAYMNVLGLESRSEYTIPEVVYATTGFSETTTVDGLIEIFDKTMHYTSRLTGEGEAPLDV
ncbi:MAG TPA: hypothetical protein HA256_07070 [Methanoregulaceae archaeon]|nr:hypothetical protein [Methanoregulaceae archaeon]